MSTTHPNPYSAALYEHCRAKPDAVEDHPWDETVFKVRDKIFAFLGRMDAGVVTVKVPPEDLDFLLGLPNVRRARYVGRFGWLSVHLDDDDTLEMARGLIDDSYDLIASRRR